MRFLAALFLFSLSSFAGVVTNYSQMQVVLLDAGANSFTIRDSVSGTDLPMTINPGTNRRLKLAISIVFAPPTASTVATPCNDPCVVTIRRADGIQYYWTANTDNAGANSTGWSANTSTYDRQSAGATPCTIGVGMLPMIEPAITTTAPLPMPREVIGQDCYVDRTQLPLTSPHASTGIKLFLRTHSIAYTTLGRIDGKVSVQVNSGNWITLTNANSSLVPVDEMKWFVLPNLTPTTGPDFTATPNSIGGPAQVRDYLLTIADGTIGSGDTAVTIGWRFNGTEGITSGFRVLEMYLVDGPECTLTALTKSSTTASATCASHGYSTGDTVIMRGADGMRMVMNGPRSITVSSSSVFTFATCGTDRSGGSKVTSCTSAAGSPDGSYMPPVSRTVLGGHATQQAYAITNKSIIALSAFLQTDPSTWTVPGGGDATRGSNLFNYGNTTGTPSEHNLVNPMLPYFGNKILAQCSSCHSHKTGKDLKYYNFSNRAIIERSYFHGFSTQDGLDIATYIRSLNIAVSTQARPWNPPMQTGPGMSCCTWAKASSLAVGAGKLTNIIVTSNSAVMTVFSTSPTVKIGDPLYIYGASVDTDLNGYWTVTGVTATTVSFTTASVANATYTESTLVANMANDFMAGCGVDCVVTYPYSKHLVTVGGNDAANWPWNAYVEPRDIAYPWQFADLSDLWWAPIHPEEVPGYNNTGQYATAQGNFETLYDDTIYGDFNSWKNATVTPVDPVNCGTVTTGYGTCLFQDFQDTWQQNISSPTSTYPFTVLAPGAAGNYAPSMIYTFRQGITNLNAMYQWAMAVDKGTLPMNVQRMTDIKGAATIGSGYPPWGIASEVFTFRVGAHLNKMDPNTGFDKLRSTYNYLANIWYINAPSVNGGNGYDEPSSPISSDYYQAFIDDVSSMRNAGIVKVLTTPLLVPQAGQQQPNLARSSGVSSPGTDWANLMYAGITGADARSAHFYDWSTDAEVTTMANRLLAMKNSLAVSRTASYWTTVMYNTQLNNTNPVTSFGCTAQAAFQEGNLNACSGLQGSLTNLALFSDDSTAVNDFKTFLESLTWTISPTHDFDDDVAAATAADTGDYGTGTLTAPGSVTVTFASYCPGSSASLAFPTIPVLIRGAGANDVAETRYPTGGTCAARGGTGTLTFTTTEAHTSPIRVSWGCGKDNLYPNWPIGNAPTTFRCSNQQPVN